MAAGAGGPSEGLPVSAPVGSSGGIEGSHVLWPPPQHRCCSCLGEGHPAHC